LPQAKGNATYNIAVTRVKANSNPQSTEFYDMVEELTEKYGGE